MIHADESRQIKAAVQWAQKRGYQIVLSGARDAWKHADWLAENKIPVIFRHIFSAPPHRSSPHDDYFKAPGILARAGVPLSIGSAIRRMGNSQPKKPALTMPLME